MRPLVEVTGDAMPLDEMTRRNLEIVESMRGGANERAGTLVGGLDRTRTPMGARRLREWLLAPLLSVERIDPIFEAVVEATEEAVLNALMKAETMTGINGNTVHALPYDRLAQTMKKYGR